MYNVTIVGASGAVGREILKTLEKRNFPIEKLDLLSSARSAGQEFDFKGKKIIAQDLEKYNIENVDFAFFSAGSTVSNLWAKKFADAGAIVIDNTSLFRMDKDIPLIVPEVNGRLVEGMKSGIIANPNCSTIQMVMALKKIDELYGLQKIVVSTYQSVSGSGQKGMEELRNQLSGESKESSVYSREIGNNLIPQIDDFTENGFTKEEMKMINETKKIMEKETLEINATCVRVPVMRGHSESVYVETEKEIQLNELLAKWNETPNLIVERAQENFATPKETEGTYETYVGRIRKDLDKKNALSFWVVSDNLLKGAALNSIQIAESIIAKK